MTQQAVLVVVVVRKARGANAYLLLIPRLLDLPALPGVPPLVLLSMMILLMLSLMR